MTYTDKMLSMTYMIDMTLETMRRYANNRDFLETEEFLELQGILMEFQEKVFRKTDLSDNLNKRIARLAFKQLRNEVAHERDSRLMRRKVYPDALGNIVVTDPTVLNIFAENNIDIDRKTGTPLTPGKPEECFGNGNHRGFIQCCERCQHFQQCFSENTGAYVSIDILQKRKKAFGKIPDVEQQMCANKSQETFGNTPNDSNKKMLKTDQAELIRGKTNKKDPIEQCASVNLNEDELTILRYFARLEMRNSPLRTSLIKKLDRARSAFLSPKQC